jgi:hypothetical protein
MTHDELDEVKSLARQRIGRGDLAAAVDGLLAHGRAEALEAVLNVLSVEGLLTGRVQMGIFRVQASFTKR